MKQLTFKLNWEDGGILQNASSSMIQAWLIQLQTLEAEVLGAAYTEALRVMERNVQALDIDRFTDSSKERVDGAIRGVGQLSGIGAADFFPAMTKELERRLEEINEDA